MTITDQSHAKPLEAKHSEKQKKTNAGQANQQFPLSQLEGLEQGPQKKTRAQKNRAQRTRAKNTSENTKKKNKLRMIDSHPTLWSFVESEQEKVRRRTLTPDRAPKPACQQAGEGNSGAWIAVQSAQQRTLVRKKAKPSSTAVAPRLTRSQRHPNRQLPGATTPSPSPVNRVEPSPFWQGQTSRRTEPLIGMAKGASEIDSPLDHPIVVMPPAVQPKGSSDPNGNGATRHTTRPGQNAVPNSSPFSSLVRRLQERANLSPLLKAPAKRSDAPRPIETLESSRNLTQAEISPPHRKRGQRPSPSVTPSATPPSPRHSEPDIRVLHSEVYTGISGTSSLVNEAVNSTVDGTVDGTVNESASHVAPRFEMGPLVGYLVMGSLIAMTFVI